MVLIDFREDFKQLQKQMRFNPILNSSTFQEFTVNLATYAEWSGTIDYFYIETVNKINSGLVTIDTIEFLLKNGVKEYLISVNAEGPGRVNSGSATCFSGQNVDNVALGAIITLISLEGKTQKSINAAQSHVSIHVEDIDPGISLLQMPGIADPFFKKVIIN